MATELSRQLQSLAKLQPSLPHPDKVKVGDLES